MKLTSDLLANLEDKAKRANKDPIWITYDQLESMLLAPEADLLFVEAFSPDVALSLLGRIRDLENELNDFAEVDEKRFQEGLKRGWESCTNFHSEQTANIKRWNVVAQKAISQMNTALLKIRKFPGIDSIVWDTADEALNTAEVWELLNPLPEDTT